MLDAVIMTDPFQQIRPPSGYDFAPSAKFVLLL